MALTKNLKKKAGDYSVYILCCVDGTLYTGITTNVERRLTEHQSAKGGSYTRAHPGLTMVYVESSMLHGDALRRELAIKKLSRDKKLVLIEEHSREAKKKDSHHPAKK